MEICTHVTLEWLPIKETVRHRTVLVVLSTETQIATKKNQENHSYTNHNSKSSITKNDNSNASPTRKW